MSEDSSCGSKQDKEDLSNLSFQFGKRKKQNPGQSTSILAVNSIHLQENKISQNQSQKKPEIDQPEANIDSRQNIPLEETIQQPNIVQMSMPPQNIQNTQYPKMEIQITSPIERIRMSSFFEDDQLVDMYHAASRMKEQRSHKKIDQILQAEEEIQKTDQIQETQEQLTKIKTNIQSQEEIQIVNQIDQSPKDIQNVDPNIQSQQEKIQPIDQIQQSQKKQISTNKYYPDQQIDHELYRQFERFDKQDNQRHKKSKTELTSFGKKPSTTKFRYSHIKVENIKSQDFKLKEYLGIWNQESKSLSKSSLSQKPQNHSLQKSQTEVNFQPFQKEESLPISEIYEEKTENRVENTNVPQRQVCCFHCGKKHYANQCDQIKCYNCKKSGHVAKYCQQPQKCRQCGSTDHLARDCKAIDTYRQNKLCLNCNQQGHFAKECTTKPMKCFLCHQAGHQIKFCPKNKQNNPKKQAERMLKLRVCFNCKKEGHYATECPEPTSCHACGQEGHFLKDCPHAMVRPYSFDASLHDPGQVEREESVDKAESEPDVRNKKPFLRPIYKKKKKSVQKVSQKSSKKKEPIKNGKPENKRTNIKQQKKRILE